MSAVVRVLVTPRDDNPYQELLYRHMPRDRVVVAYLDGPTGSQSLNLLLAPLVLCWYRLIGYRVLHIHWLFKFSLPWARGVPAARIVMQWWFHLYLDVAHALGYRILWTAHDVVSHERVFHDDDRALAILLRRADAVIALSPASARDLARRGARDVRVVPFGPYLSPDTEVPARGLARQVLDLDDQDCLVVSVGKVEPYKGVDILLRAVARLPEQPRVKVVVAGACRDDAYRHAVLEAAQVAGSRATLRLERISDEDLRMLLAAADFAALPFLEITNSSAVLTALAFGVPVIVPELENLSDLPERCVIRYRPGEDDLASALARCALMPAHERRAMSDAARAYVSATDWTSVALATQRLYDEIVTRR